MTIENIYMAAMGGLWVVTYALVANAWNNLKKEMVDIKNDMCKKVDKEIYNATQDSLIQDIRAVKKGQDRMAATLEEIKLSLARAEGAKQALEKINKRDDNCLS